MSTPDPTPPPEPDYPRDVPPEVLAMADVAVLQIHRLIDDFPAALVVSAYRRGVAAGEARGRTAAAADIRESVDRRGRFVEAFPPVSAEALRRNDAVLGAYAEAARIAEGPDTCATKETT